MSSTPSSASNGLFHLWPREISHYRGSDLRIRKLTPPGMPAHYSHIDFGEAPRKKRSERMVLADAGLVGPLVSWTVGPRRDQSPRVAHVLLLALLQATSAHQLHAKMKHRWKVPLDSNESIRWMAPSSVPRIFAIA
jgi:hypothetical protein